MKRIVVGISGASGVIYGVRALALLRQMSIETHLVMSRAARLTLAQETDFKVADVEAMAFIGLRILNPRCLVVTFMLFAKAW